MASCAPASTMGRFEAARKMPRSTSGAARCAAVSSRALALAAVATAALCWEYLPPCSLGSQTPRFARLWRTMPSRAAWRCLGINIVQVLLAFLPGEPVDSPSGYAFGFWGTAYCLVASGLATSVIYWATRRWAGSSSACSSTARSSTASPLKSAKRLELIMLVVFLIPGTPKDFLTYFAGLTNMRFLPVVLIATFGRIPSIVTSTITASAVGAGNWTLVACTLVASALLLAAGGLIYRCLRSRTR